jgi:hypothetical protein
VPFAICSVLPFQVSISFREIFGQKVFEQKVLEQKVFGQKVFGQCPTSPGVHFMPRNFGRKVFGQICYPFVIVLGPIPSFLIVNHTHKEF